MNVKPNPAVVAENSSQSTPSQYMLDLIFFLLFFVTPWLISTELKQVFNTPKYLWVGLLAGLAVTFWLLECVQIGEIRIPRLRTLWFFVALMAWETVSLFQSPALRLSMREFGFQLALFALFVVALCNVRSRDRIENLIHFAIASGVIAAGFGIMQYYGLDEKLLPLTQRWPWPFRFGFLVLPKKPEETIKIYSFMGHRNYLAGYLIALLPLVLTRFVASCNLVWDECRRKLSLLAAGVTFGAFLAVLAVAYVNAWLGILLLFVLALFFLLLRLRFLLWTILVNRPDEELPPWMRSFRAALERTCSPDAWRGKNLDVFDRFVLGVDTLRPVMIYATATVLMAAAVLLTHTRGAWVGLAAGTFFFLVFCLYKFHSLIRWQSVLSLALVGLVVLLAFGVKDLRVLGNEVHNPLNKMYRSAGARFEASLNLRAGSAFQRILIWRTTWSIIFDSAYNFLFGTGIGTFGLNYMPYQSQILKQERFARYIPMVNKSIYAHSEYFHFWSEIGLVGLLLLFGTVFTFFRRMSRYLHSCEVNYQNFFLLGLVSSVLGVLCHNVFSFSLHLAYTAAFFYCGAALALRYTRFSEISIPLGGRRRSMTLALPESDVDLGMQFDGEGGKVLAWASRSALKPTSPMPRGDWTLALIDEKGKETVRELLPMEEVYPACVLTRIDRPLRDGVWQIELRDEEGRVQGRLQQSTSGPLSSLRYLVAGVLAVAFCVLATSLFHQIARDHHWRNGFLKFRFRRYQASFLDFIKALQHEPERGEILFDFGRALMDSNRNALGVKRFEEAKYSFVDPANSHNEALCYYKNQDYADSQYHYQEALDLNPIYEQSLSNLAFLRAAMGDEEQAREILEVGARYYYQNAQFHSTLGVIYAKRNDFDRAEELFAAAVRVNPKLTGGWVNLGTVRYNRGDYESAREAFLKAREFGHKDKDLVDAKVLGCDVALAQKTLQKNPQDFQTIRSLGLGLSRLGELATNPRMTRLHHERAVEALRIVTAQSPLDLEARFRLALSMAALGYRQRALHSLQNLLKAAQADTPLYELIERRARLLEVELKSPEKAEP